MNICNSDKNKNKNIKRKKNYTNIRFNVLYILNAYIICLWQDLQIEEGLRSVRDLKNLDKKSEL